MPSDTTIDGSSQLRAVRLVPLTVMWYFFRHPRKMLGYYWEYAMAFRESFSILFLLKTLFSPWKTIKDNYPERGFNFQAIAETFFLNVTTRGIGALIRISAIIVGLIIQLALLAGFLVYLIWWIAFPFILIALPFYVVISFFL